MPTKVASKYMTWTCRNASELRPIAGVEESEGIAATAVAVNGAGGLLVVTDDDNGDEATNYKIVEWSAYSQTPWA